ncbi:MAG: bifunctional hydroxymethylpyrimidine kinase/phosphomethylpyrimidine kinase [Deltaproteobacteria bacterium]|nr:bifunctional hydroxymethylpyrimidine kinase/phosphomethylpyrimidine kinase [Deltaproteobacteria bacterium]
MTEAIPTILTIAGSDPSSGAGLQADLYTLHDLGCRGRSVVTAITAQTNDRVLGVWPTSADVLTQQLATAADGVELSAVKVGMVATAANVWATIWFLKSRPHGDVVIDPLLHSSSGLPLLDKSAIPIFRQQLLPYATVITPNIPEAMALAGMQIATVEAMEVAAKSIYEEVYRFRGGGDRPLVIAIKGGHLRRDPVDVVYDGTQHYRLSGERLPGGIHGSGCRFATAIAAGMAKKMPVVEAIAAAKVYVTELVRKGEKDPI